MNKIVVAIDAMGGDFGPSVTVPASLDALIENPSLKIIFVGDETAIRQEIARFSEPKPSDRFDIVHTAEVVKMDDSPAFALRNKKESSMRKVLDAVKSNEASACVSAGNTGALMVISRYVLKMIPGVDRPAIMYPLPVRADQEKMGHMRMLDLGANVDCSGGDLFQFAVMGSVLAKAIDHIPNPRVGLLNIGSEEIKGSEAVKQAAQMLSDCPEINFIGFVEGTDMYHGRADVVVCDGFVGNVALKTSEGIAKMMVEFLRREFSRNLYTKFVAAMAMPILRSIRSRFDTSQYNGACFLGLNGIVIKSHGNAPRHSFKKAILEAIKQVEEKVPEKIGSQVEHQLTKRTTA